MILSNDTGRVIQHTGAMLEGPPGAVEESSSNDTREEGSSSGVATNGSNAVAPMVNATVRKYADAVRRIVAASSEAVQGLDEKVSSIYFIRTAPRA
jgi:hypothetical protein